MTKEKRKPIQVMVAILNEGNVCVQVANILTKIVAESFITKKWEPTIFYSKQTGVDVNRNLISRHFLTTNCEYLLMMDDDNPPLRNPLELIDFHKDVMVLPTLMFKGDVGKLAFNVFKKVPHDWQTMVYDGKNKMFKIDRAGSGCILIKRNVLEKIKAPFKVKLDKDGVRTVGEDMMFSDRVWKAGFEMWGNWDYCCSHYKTVDLMSVADLILKKKQDENVGKN